MVLLELTSSRELSSREMSKGALPCLLECSRVTQGNDTNGLCANAKVSVEEAAPVFPLKRWQL